MPLGMGPHDFVAGHQRAHAEFVDGELDFGNRLCRCVHRNNRRWRHLVGNVPEHIGIHHIQRTAEPLAQLVVWYDLSAEANGAVDGREIDAGLFQAPRIEVRQHNRRPVEGQRAGRRAPGTRLG